MTNPQDQTYGHQLSADFLAKYEITGVLGEGGMGQVLRGRQVGLGREVAIKFLTLRSYATPERRQRFRDEAQRCAQMRHPNLVEVYDYGEEGERPYMVMELVDGESLADRLKREKTVPIAEALKIGVDICQGLAYAHDLGLVHRDIKSDNILLGEGGKKVKVADFGIAVEADEGSEHGNQIIGTPSYMSPEQASGKKADGRSDIYSTGVILYEMLCGQVPFTGETSMAIIIKHLNERAGSMQALNEEIPPQLEEIIQRALAKDPDHRYQSVQEFATRLKKGLSLLKSWKSQPKQGSSGSFSTTSMTSINVVAPETDQERMVRYGTYAVGAGVVLSALIGLLYFFVFAPPTYQAKDFREEVGFRQTEVVYFSSHPCPTVVEYGEAGESDTQTLEAESKETNGHEVQLEGLKEDTVYRWRPVFPAGQFGDWREFTTRILHFTEIQIEPRVRGAKIEWRTSLPVESEIEYLDDKGRVHRRQYLIGEKTKHEFLATFQDPPITQKIRINGKLNSNFSSSTLIEEVPMVDLNQADQLVLAISETIKSDNPLQFPGDFLTRYRTQAVAEKIQTFQEIREIFFSDPQVESARRVRMVQALDRLHEFDLTLAYLEPAADFRTRAVDAYGDGFRASRKLGMHPQKTIPLQTQTKRMVYDPNPPEDPKSGDPRPDGKQDARFEVRGVELAEVKEAVLEMVVKDVAPNCFFEVRLGRGRNPEAQLTFFPSREDVATQEPYSGTFYLRIDPRLVRTKKDLQGWVSLTWLKDTVSLNTVDRVQGSFHSLKLHLRND